MMFKMNQKGKLSIEALGWLLVVILLVIIVGAVVMGVVNSKSNDITTVSGKPTLSCPPNSAAVDVRPWLPDGLPVTSGVPAAGTLGTSTHVVIANSPFVDLDEDLPVTAELVCVVNDGGL
ncbi:hypothetical protein D3C78_18490 [compost metagenome]